MIGRGYGGTYISAKFQSYPETAQEYVFRSEFDSCPGASYYMDVCMGTNFIKEKFFDQIFLQYAEAGSVNPEYSRMFIDGVPGPKSWDWFKAIETRKVDDTQIVSGRFVAPSSRGMNFRVAIDRNPNANPGELVLLDVKLNLLTPLFLGEGFTTNQGSIGTGDSLPNGWSDSVYKGNQDEGAGDSAAAAYPAKDREHQGAFSDQVDGYHLRCNRPDTAPTDTFSWAKISIYTQACLGTKYRLTLSRNIIDISSQAYLVIQEGSDAPQVVSTTSNDNTTPKPFHFQAQISSLTGQTTTFDYTPVGSQELSIAIVCPPGASGGVGLASLSIAPPDPGFPSFTFGLPPRAIIPPSPVCTFGPAPTNFQSLPSEEDISEIWISNTAGNPNECNCVWYLFSTRPNEVGPWKGAVTSPKTGISTFHVTQKDIKLDPTCSNSEYLAKVDYTFKYANMIDVQEISILYADACKDGEPEWKEIVKKTDLYNSVTNYGSSTTVYQSFLSGTTKIHLRIQVKNNDRESGTSGRIIFNEISLTKNKYRGITESKFNNGLPATWEGESFAFDTTKNDYIALDTTKFTSTRGTGTLGNTPGILLSCGSTLTSENLWAGYKVSTDAKLCPMIYELKITGSKMSLQGTNAWVIVQQGDDKPYLDVPCDYSQGRQFPQNYHAYVLVDDWSKGTGGSDLRTLTQLYPGTGGSKISISLVCGANTEAAFILNHVQIGQA